MIEISNDYLKACFTGEIKPCQQSIEFYQNLKIHSNGEYPKSLIEERRPSEMQAIKDYREKIFTPITESSFNKIITSLGKIRKSPDYAIKYNNKDLPKTIKDSESPHHYFEKNYPTHKSITNWAFTSLLKNYLIDSNAVVLVMPNNIGTDSNVYLKPIPIIFNSDKIIDFITNEYAVLLSQEKCVYTDKRKTYQDGNVFYVVTDAYIQRWVQASVNKQMTMEYEYIHELGFMPCFKLKGNFFSNDFDKVVYKPKIYPIIHRLNEALREYSDLQAEVVQHIHSEKWVYATQSCGTCMGTGKTKNGDKLENCTNQLCSNGRVTNNPYQTLIVTPPNSMEGSASIPTPPAGYIQKQVEIVKIQDERIKDHIKSALSAINMEFLAETPLNQSGTAKEVDKDELNNFVYSIAEDIVAIMDEVAITTIKYRYGKLIPNENDLMAIVPVISVPERFDLLNTSYLLNEIKNAKDSGLNTYTLNALQIDYANKKFCHDKDIAKKLEAIISLDPLSGYTQDDKLSMLQNNGISELDYVVSSNIETFINTAIISNDLFLNLPTNEKIIIIKKIAEAKLLEIKPMVNVMNDVTTSQTL